MKLITWNVNGIRARQAQVAELLSLERPDVVCLQEIKASPEQVPALLVAPDGYWSYWHGSGGYSGVAVLVRQSLTATKPVFAHPPFDFECRIVTADLGEFTVASVYVPNGGKDYDAKLRFLDALGAWAAETNRRPEALVICGDLNVACEDRDVHPKDRKAGQIGTRPEERTGLGALFGSGLTDVGRTLDPDNDELFTWWAPWRQRRERNIGWRIDYVLASPVLSGRAINSASRREFGTSDHAPVIVTFRDVDPVTGEVT
jgi:exodeoxyribonuclease-3